MRFLTRRVIHNFQGDPYLVRWTLFSCRAFGIFIHQILRSDDDRDLHDHPWPFWTFILKGRYTEYVPMDSPPLWNYYRSSTRNECEMSLKSKVCGPGTLVRHKAEDCHRLELDKPVWTLFIHGRRCREWGFHTPDGWIDWRTYIDKVRNAETSPMED